MHTTDQNQIPPSPFPMSLSIFGAVLFLTSGAALPVTEALVKQLQEKPLDEVVLQQAVGT